MGELIGTVTTTKDGLQSRLDAPHTNNVDSGQCLKIEASVPNNRSSVCLFLFIFHTNGRIANLIINTGKWNINATVVKLINGDRGSISGIYNTHEDNKNTVYVKISNYAVMILKRLVSTGSSVKISVVSSLPDNVTALEY